MPRNGTYLDWGGMEGDLLVLPRSICGISHFVMFVVLSSSEGI